MYLDGGFTFHFNISSISAKMLDNIFNYLPYSYCTGEYDHKDPSR
jgi:hypothetical protein